MYPEYGPSNRNGGTRIRALGLGIGEPGERLQVGQALAALDPPGPLPPDRGAEAELERRVEVLVGVAEHAAEQPVDVLGGDAGQRQPPGQVHVARRVQGEVHPVHAAVALELHQEGAGPRVLVLQLQRFQGRPHRRRGGGFIPAHARTESATGESADSTDSMAPVYTSISRSAVAGQPNADACASAPRDSSASRPGEATSPDSTCAHTPGSCPSTRTPEKPSLTAVRSPPTAA